ncbi:MAG: DUF1501 domain-containing protein [Pirellulales bacterium]
MAISQRSTRRMALWQAGMGIGALAACDLLAREELRAGERSAPRSHHPPKATAVISLFMHGGPSQVDTFDPKPTLERYAGKTLPESYASLNLEFTKATEAKILPSRRKFRPCGQSGLVISDAFTHLPRVADELAVVRSCYHTEFAHAPALYMAHSGTRLLGRPSMGAWMLYGLGAETDNLPGYVVMREGPLKGGPLTYGHGFLPAAYAATEVHLTGSPILYLDGSQTLSPERQRRVLDLTQQLNRNYLSQHKTTSDVESRIAAYELAFRMQTAAPEAVDFSQESAATLALYGLDHDDTRPFGLQCLTARRLVERGVRFVQLYHGSGNEDWDTHGNNDQRLVKNCQRIDRPVTGLIQDLRARGLLDSTLVVWGGEFGRTPTTEGSDGRDHNPYGYSVWMAGGGIRGGVTYGETDEFGFKAQENPTRVRDLHATMMHLLGLDPERLTYYFQGVQQRLTQVDGPSRVIQEIVA